MATSDRTILVASLLTVLAVSGRFAMAQEAASEEQWTWPPVIAGPTPADGPGYPVSRFVLEYVRQNPLHPPVKGPANMLIRLGRTPEGYVVSRPGVPKAAIKLSDAPLRPLEAYHASALQRILESIRDWYTQRSYIGVYVAPDPYQIDAQGRDLRPEGDTELTILITTGIVTEMRSLASGERIDPADRIDNPLHQRILVDSPIQPHHDGDAAHRDLLRSDILDRYLFHTSRHPGRRVDVALSPAMDPGTVAMDYLITENRPLVLYGRVGNTGTPATGRTQVGFGLFHNQLTNADDIFSFDYVATSFEDTYVLSASYDRPFRNDRFRWRAYGGYQRYTADQVGFSGARFTGESWSAGGEVAANVHQDRDLFVDLVAGARVQNVKVDNTTFAIEGEETFALPYLGARLERRRDWVSTTGFASLEWQVASTDQLELDALGRFDADGRFPLLQWSLDHSFFLEPVLDRAAWEDPTTPNTSTLAHELAFAFRGQYAFDKRLIPQFTQVAGGLYTVRGYPQSVAAGDSVIILRGEYRYHLPRALGVQAEPMSDFFGGPFRVAPQYVYGRPDWDLVFRGFLDFGQTIVSDPLFFEHDQTLLGAGIGVELQLRRNLNARVDWGVALLDIDGADAGSNEAYFVITLMY